MDGFRQCLHEAGDADLVDHLGQLAGTGLAHAGDGLGIGHGHRTHAFHAGFGAAAHDGEATLLGTGLAAGNGGIDEVHALFAGDAVQFAADIGRGGGVVHVQGAGLHAGKGAVVPQNHAAQVVVVADAGEDDVGLCRGFARGECEAVCRPFGQPLFGLCGGAVVDRHGMAGFGQVAGHGVAHDAEAQKGHVHGGGGAAHGGCLRGVGGGQVHRLQGACRADAVGDDATDRRDAADARPGTWPLCCPGTQGIGGTGPAFGKIADSSQDAQDEVCRNTPEVPEVL